MKIPAIIAVAIAALLAGCSTPAPAPAPEKKGDVATLQGEWQGPELTTDDEEVGVTYMTFAGNVMDYHGADDNDQAKGTFVLNDQVTPHQLVVTITECPTPEMIGVKSYIIYKIEDGTLTITGNQPGATNFPAKFNAEGAREFALKREQ